jgi:lipopolysaccharide export system protein LptA
MILRARAFRLGLSLLFTLTGGGAALAASPASSPAPSARTSVPVPAPLPLSGQATTINGTRIETDLTNWNQNTGAFTMPHRVRFSRPGTDGIADHAEGNSKLGTIKLIGHVVIHDSGNGAQSLSGGAGGGGGASSTLTADTVTIDSKGRLYTADGHVQFTQTGRTATADHGSLDRSKNILRLEGNVNLNDAGSAMTGSSVTDNLVTKDVDMRGSPLTLKQMSSANLPTGNTPAGANRPGGATPSGGATPPAGATAVDQVQTDEAHYNQNSGDFTMPHKATFSRPGTDAVGDRANGNTKRGTLTLEGNVSVHDNGSAPEAGTESAYGKGGASTMNCDKLDVNARSRLYTASGNVKFEQGTRKGSADHGVLDRGRETLHLDGKVHLNDGSSTMATDNVDYNLLTKDVVARGAPIVITQPVPSSEPHPSGSPSPKPKKRRLSLPF